ncbi:MAG: DUF3152 domain-containing protein [Micromonosporaceae bacterium]
MQVTTRDRDSSSAGALLLILGVLAVVISSAVGVYLLALRSEAAPVAAPTTPAATSTPTPVPTPSPTPTPVSTFAENGPGTYAYATGDGPVLGTAGTLRRFRVAVETGLPVPVADFAASIETTLGDPRSWIAGNNVRLQRVSGDATGTSFTIYLVTPGTAWTICNSAGIDIRVGGKPYTSCRVGSKVVINVARYLTGVPNYGAPIEAYRQYAINHEVGHALGHGHELCPGSGKLAPVMQQQTLSLEGCVANSWPYVDGKRYAGPAGHL